MGIGISNRLIQIGKATAAVMAALIAPQVGRSELADVVGYVENAGAPTSVVPDFIGQKLFDTSGLEFYIAFGTTAGEWTPMGLNTLSATELAFLDGALSTNAVASKAAILDAAAQLTLPSALPATTAGTGITGGTGTIIKYEVRRQGTLLVTSCYIDLTGLQAIATDGDIIGDAANPASLLQITTARSGVMEAIRMTCLELPAGASTDIDLFAATPSTGKKDDAMSGLAGQSQLIAAGGAWANGTVNGGTAVPAADSYIYLANGAGANAGTYTAGKFLIEFFGY